MTISRNLSFLAEGASSTGVLGVANGGTGLTTLTAGYIPYGNGTSAFSSSSGLTTNGSNLTATGSITGGSLVTTGGGTLNGSFTVGSTGYPQFVASAGSAAYLKIDATVNGGGQLWRIGDGIANFGVFSIYNQTANLFPLNVFGSGGVSIGNTTDPGATNLSVTGTGNFGTTIGVGAATPSASGAGITFPATQSASTDVNTLDDYEEGTWTPTLGGTATYNTQSGTYTKIGRLVTINFFLDVLAIGTGSASQISGLPFTVFATNRGAGSVGYVVSPVTAYVSISPVAIANQTYINFICSSTLGVWTNTGAVFGTGTAISGTLTYFV